MRTKDRSAAVPRTESAKPTMSAFDRAARYLSAQPHTEAEVRRYLEKKEYTPSQIDDAIEKLLDYRYLDDAAYCQSYFRQAAHRGKGRRRIEAELLKKGVKRHVLEKALDDLLDTLAAQAQESARQNRAASSRQPQQNRLPDVDSDPEPNSKPRPNGPHQLNGQPDPHCVPEPNNQPDSTNDPESHNQLEPYSNSDPSWDWTEIDTSYLYDERERALAVAGKMWRQQQAAGKPIDEAFLARVGRRLFSLGYAQDQIYKILRTLRQRSRDRDA